MVPASFSLVRRAVLSALVVLAVVVLASACASSSPESPSQPFELSLRFSLAGGEEATKCVYARVPGAPGEEVFLRGGLHELSPGAHHYLVYRTTVTEWRDDMTVPFECGEHDGAMRGVTTYVTGGQAARANADFPSAAALPLRGGEILLVQGHFLNASPAATDASVRVVLRLVGPSAVEHRAGLLRYYDPFIFVPPRGKASAQMRCTLERDIVMLSAGAHMHARGVHYEAYIDKPGEPRATTPFFTSDDWLHPSFFLGFERLPAGTSIRFRCDYASDRDEPVVQGLSAARDEMCMFNAFYYPAMEPGEEICADMHEVGNGQASCVDTVACLDRCPLTDRPDFASGSPYVGACWQKCVVDSCPGASAALFPLLTCADAKCRAECAAPGEACRACAAAKCATEQAACVSSTCAP